MSLAGTKTHENLKAAFAGESQANRRYLYFAKIADVEGEPDIAGLFRDTAEGETGHAHGHLEYMRKVGDPATDLPAKEQRSVINVVPGVDGAAEEYRVGTLAFPVGADGIDALTRHVQGLLEVNPALRVNLRADQRTQYEWVHPVLKAVSAAAARVDGVVVTPRVNLVVVPEES